MSLTHTYNGSALGFDVPPTKVNIPSRAEVGSVSQGGVSPEDPTAALTLVGWRPYIVEETACSQPRLFTGWVLDRGIGRSFDQAQFVGPDARIYDTSIGDLNAAFRMRIISGSDGNRPEESVDARLAWLLSSTYLSGLVADTGYVRTGLTLMMDAANYIDGFPEDVLTDCAGRYATPINWFAFWDPDAAASSLFFNYVGEATFDCTISISNLEADTYTGDTPSGTCFAPTTESQLDRSGETVYSTVGVKYAHGTVWETMPSTAAAAIERGTTISRPYIGKASTARLAGKAFLAAHAVETDRVRTTIRVPRTVVGLIQAGMRMAVKFSHFEGLPVAPDTYRNGTTMRIVACNPRAIDDYARFYDVDLELVSPRVPPTAAIYAELHFHHGGLYGCIPESTYPDGAAIASWETTGDAPHLGFVEHPTTGAVEYVPYPTASCNWQGIRILADATVDVESVGRFGGVASEAGSSIKVDVRQNGTIIATHTESDPSPGLHYWGGIVTLNPTTHPALGGVTVEAEDVFTVSFTFYDWAGFEFYAADPADLYAETHLVITGTGDWDGTVPGVELPPPSGGPPTTATTDPTVTDDSDAGYTVGSRWINTTTGEEFVLVDATPGAAVWLSTTAQGAPTTVDYLVGTASGALSAEIVVGTTPGGELGGTWASPTVDATHAGSTHLALGSTSSTAAPGDHTHSRARLFSYFLGD